MELNNNQKNFLLDKHYVTYRTLDAAPEEGWEDYFINEYKWEFSPTKNRWRMYELNLIGIGTNFDEIDQMLNLTPRDLQTLMSL